MIIDALSNINKFSDQFINPQNPKAMYLLNNQKLQGLSHLFLFLFIVSANLSFSQQAITSSGGNQDGSGGTISFSVGQNRVHNFVSESVSLTEGVQHPYEILIVSITDNLHRQQLNLKAFPNPFNSHFTLYVDEEFIQNLRFEFLDSGGKLLQYSRVISTETQITIKDLPSGIYILRVYRSEKELEVFKVIKR